MVKTLALIFIVVAAGCASGEQRSAESERSRPPDDGQVTSSQIAPAPRWMRDYCGEVARKIKQPVLCPARVPRGTSPTENLEVLRPSRRGYVFEAEAERHWVFVASPFDLEGDYGPMRFLSSAQVRGLNGRWLYASPAGGIHAGHLVLTWREGRFHYAVSAHTEHRDSQPLRNDLLSVAEGMRLYR